VPTPRSGRALDIGTGNGSLAIIMATRHPELYVTGVDLWGADWSYSMNQCAVNAAQCNVSDRVTFERASADQLPFANETFDVVVSHFVFHEVKSAPDMQTVIAEALRVLKKGGVFSFHDMFLDTSLYGTSDALLETIRSLGISEVTLLVSKELLDLPRLLTGRRALGASAILFGTK